MSRRIKALKAIVQHYFEHCHYGLGGCFCTYEKRLSENECVTLLWKEFDKEYPKKKSQEDKKQNLYICEDCQLLYYREEMAYRIADYENTRLIKYCIKCFNEAAAKSEEA